MGSLDADVASARRMVRIWFYFGNFTFVHMDQDPTFRVASLAYCPYNFLHSCLRRLQGMVRNRSLQGLLFKKSCRLHQKKQYDDSKEHQIDPGQRDQCRADAYYQSNDEARHSRSENTTHPTENDYGKDKNDPGVVCRWLNGLHQTHARPTDSSGSQG
jgi:hypothetical protein